MKIEVSRTLTRKNNGSCAGKDLGKIIQISTATAFNKEIDRDMVFIYALTHTGNIFEFISGAWVKLPELKPANVKTIKDGKLV